jgi:hypothetical protein
MPVKYTSDEARRLMLEAGFEPLDPFVNAQTNWRSKCIKCEMESSPRFSHVVNKGTGCRFCSSNKISETDATDLMKSGGFDPLEPYPGAQRPWLCRCLTCGLESKPTFAGVKHLGAGCKFCNRNQLSKNEIETRLDLQKLKLQGSYVSSRVAMELHCLNCNFDFSATLKQIKNVIVPCPNCRELANLEFANEAARFMRSAGLEPLTTYVNNSTPWESTCLNCKRTVKPSFSSIRSGHSGCGYCAKVKVDEEVAIQVMEAAQLHPLDPFVSSKAKWRCLCLECGGEVYPRFANISSGNGGCTPCGTRRRAGLRTMDEEVARSFMIEAGIDPIEPYVNSATKWKSKCLKCSKIIFPMLNTIRNGDGGCKHCAKNYVEPAEARKLMIQHGFEPLVDYPGAGTGWLSRHSSCGREVAPMYSSIKSGGGCKFCTNKGFQFHLPGYLYLITNDSLNAHKIGVATSEIKQDRLKVHVRHGWMLYRKLHFDLGNDAYQLEQSMLNWLRNDKNLSPAVLQENMPQGGWSETFSSDEIDLPTVWDEVRRKYESMTLAELPVGRNE